MSAGIITLIVIASVVLFLILVWIIFGANFFKMSFGRKDAAKEEENRTVNDPSMAMLYDDEFLKEHDGDFKDIKIKAKDGIDLVAKLLVPKKPSHKYVIFFHGYRGSIVREWSPSVHLYYDNGFNVICVEERGNYDSGDKSFTMGPKEKVDGVCWVNYVVEQDKDAQILLFGHSMGGHIVMLMVGEDLPSNVKCCISDCGYADLDEQLIHTAKDMMHIPCAKFLVRIGEGYDAVFHHMHFDETTQKSLAKTKIPMCLIHGSGDKFVPIHNLDENYGYIMQAYKEKHVFEGAAHCCSEARETERFHKVCLDFTNKFIK